MVSHFNNIDIANNRWILFVLQWEGVILLAVGFAVRVRTGLPGKRKMGNGKKNCHYFDQNEME